MYRDQSVEPFCASRRHVIVHSDVCVDLNGECCKKSNRKRVTKWFWRSTGRLWESPAKPPL